jgi:hypothetical protein
MHIGRVCLSASISVRVAYTMVGQQETPRDGGEALAAVVLAHAS